MPLRWREAPRKPEDTPQASLVKRAIRLKAITAVCIASKASNAEPHQRLSINVVSVQPHESLRIVTGTTEITLTTEEANLHEESRRKIPKLAVALV